MFTAGGGHARLSCRQGTDLRIEIFYVLVLSFTALEAWARVPAVNIREFYWTAFMRTYN